jgi:phage-related protein
MRMADKERPLEWIASSYKDLMALSPDVHRRFGYALSLAQRHGHRSYEMQKRIIEGASRFSAVRAMSSPTWDCPMQRN